MSIINRILSKIYDLDGKYSLRSEMSGIFLGREEWQLLNDECKKLELVDCAFSSPRFAGIPVYVIPEKSHLSIGVSLNK